MRIDAWADVVCPWCYLGKVRLDRAVAEAGADVEIVHHAFQLDPAAPQVPVQSVVEHLGEKYGGGPAAGRAMVERVTALAAEEGLAIDHVDAPVVNTLDAHRLLALALREDGPGGQQRLLGELFAAYFQRAQNLADPAVLRVVAAAAGMAGDPVAALTEGAGLAAEVEAEVEADRRQAAAYGVTGVPFLVLDGRYAVAGAQPQEGYRRIVAELG